LRGQVQFDLTVVEWDGRPFLDGQGARRANAQAEACAITQLLAHDPGLATGYLDGALSTRGDADATAVAQLLVDADYLAGD
jgi:hypothetical protein